MRDFAWLLAVAIVGVVFIIGVVGVVRSDVRIDRYRQQVKLCATTADTPDEFRACVEVAE